MRYKKYIFTLLLVVTLFFMGCNLSAPIYENSNSEGTTDKNHEIDCENIDSPWDVSWINGNPSDMSVPVDQILLGTGLAGNGDSIIKYAKEFGVNPAFALAMFRKEASFAAEGTRARKNNNPGNIIATGDCRKQAAGLGCSGVYGETSTDGRFGVYPSMDSGIRAYFLLLNREYAPGTKRDCSNAACIIKIYCPPSDCDTQNYIEQINLGTKEYQCQLLSQAVTPGFENTHKTPIIKTAYSVDMKDPLSIAHSFRIALDQNDEQIFNYIFSGSPTFWADSMPECMGGECPCNTLMGEFCDVSKNKLIQEIQSRIQSKPECSYFAGGDFLAIYTEGWEPQWIWPYGQTSNVEFNYYRNSESGNFQLEEIIFLSVTNISSLGTTPCP